MQERTSPLHFSRRADQKTYMERPIWGPDEGVMPPKRCSVVGTFGSHTSQNCRLKLELSARTRAGTSGKPNKRAVQVWPFGFRSELFQTREKLGK
jgi:hypothetical protein